MNIGLIGTGNMGSAIIKGYITANPESEKDICAYDKDRSKLLNLVEESGIHGCAGVTEVVDLSDIIIIAVKPEAVYGVTKEIVKAKSATVKILVSIVAGLNTDNIIKMFKNEDDSAALKLIRVMPNTPALVRRGMSALCRSGGVTDQEFGAVMDIFSCLGKAEEVKESLMDCVVGISGSSPAYVYMFIEALADGAVAKGMDRNQAYRFAAQAVLGSAEMVLATGKHPGVLKDMVCSPGGTTIEAVCSLEGSGFRNAVIEAVKAATEKSISMGKK